MVAGYTGLNRSFVPPPLKLHCGKGTGRTYEPEERKEGSEIPSSRWDVDNVFIISQQLADLHWACTHPLDLSIVS